MTTVRSAALCFTGVVLWIAGLTLMIATEDIGPRVMAIVLISFGIPLAIVGGRGLRSSRHE